MSLVGGGGKTTAMFRLAEELVAQQRRVVTTTTTRIFAAQIKLAPFHILASDREQTLRDLRAALKEHPHVLVIGAANEEGKAFGVEPSLVDEMIGLDEVDVVIVEADGSRMRPFKAPGEHEPVVPASTTLLVPVVGIDALGVPLDEEHVHRPERAAALAGASLGASVEPEIIARVLATPERRTQAQTRAGEGCAAHQQSGKRRAISARARPRLTAAGVERDAGSGDRRGAKRGDAGGGAAPTRGGGDSRGGQLDADAGTAQATPAVGRFDAGKAHSTGRATRGR